VSELGRPEVGRCFLGSFATVDEVAGLVVALCADETSYMTGATLDVNGAAYMA
jgi:NAD(P)-dependent dehydrogenase (short-subunit alcohol dehydrogenase family)